jgi:hypothetical protein
VLLEHLPSYKVYEMTNILGRGAAEIHDEVGVLGGDGGTADAKPFRTNSLNQAPGKVSCGALEDTAGAAAGHRLPAAAFFENATAAAVDVCRITRVKSKADTDDKVLAQIGGAVAEVKASAVHAVQFARALEYLDPLDDMGHLSLKGTRVHKSGASDGAGDAGGKFKTGEAVICSGCTDGRERFTGSGDEAVCFHMPTSKGTGQFDNEAGEASVVDENVRAAT